MGYAFVLIIVAGWILTLRTKLRGTSLPFIIGLILVILLRICFGSLGTYSRIQTIETCTKNGKHLLLVGENHVYWPIESEIVTNIIRPYKDGSLFHEIGIRKVSPPTTPKKFIPSLEYKTMMALVALRYWTVAIAGYGHIPDMPNLAEEQGKSVIGLEDDFSREQDLSTEEYIEYSMGGLIILLVALVGLLVRLYIFNKKLPRLLSMLLLVYLCLSCVEFFRPLDTPKVDFSVDCKSCLPTRRDRTMAQSILTAAVQSDSDSLCVFMGSNHLQNVYCLVGAEKETKKR